MLFFFFSIRKNTVHPKSRSGKILGQRRACPETLCFTKIKGMDSACKYGSQKTMASDLYSQEPRKSIVYALPEAPEVLFVCF